MTLEQRPASVPVASGHLCRSINPILGALIGAAAGGTSDS